ncbi:MAG: hypothetical protein KC418_00645 [Anaerolineales bacterium]|nr:hypothetical protein [Anaerolineales bacterium]
MSYFISVPSGVSVNKGFARELTDALEAFWLAAQSKIDFGRTFRCQAFNFLET